MPSHHQVLMVGGGTAGIMIVDQLIKPADIHTAPEPKQYMPPTPYWNKMMKGKDL